MADVNDIVFAELSTTYDLPSRGRFYGDLLPNGRVTIRPTRGEQEESFASLSDAMNPNPIIKNIVKQLVTTDRLPYNDLLFSDWLAILLNIMAYSYNEKFTFRPVCTACKKPFTIQKDVSELECIVFDSVGDDYGTEPFTVELPKSKHVVQFRLTRLKDLEAGESLARKIGGDGSANPQHTAVIAQQIVSVNGTQMTSLNSFSWIRKSLGMDMRVLREAMDSKEPGYEMTPRFDCPACGNEFRTRFPMDGSFFRKAKNTVPGSVAPAKI